MLLKEILIREVVALYRGLPDAHIEKLIKPPTDTKQGGSSFTALALDNGGVGVSYNLFHRQDDLMRQYQHQDFSYLKGSSALDIIDLMLSPDPIEITVGLATINALSQFLFRQNPMAFGIDFESDLHTLLNPVPVDIVGMVGYFPSIVTKLLPLVSEIVVLEKEKMFLEKQYPFSMTDDPDDLSRCSKVLITATTVLNETLGSLLDICSKADFIAVMGPSAGFIPAPLFDMGVHVVGGIYIDDPGLFIERFSKGIKWGDAARKTWHIRDRLKTAHH